MEVWKLSVSFQGSRQERGSTYGNSVDPDHVCAVDGDSITAPDVVRVQLSDLDVLDDDVVLGLRVR